jgi:hypothetical protein
MNLVLPAAKDLRQHLDGKCANRKANDAHCSERFTPHRVHIGECVRGGDLPEKVGVIDYGREEVDGLHQRQTIGQPEDSRVIEGFATYEDSRIGSRVQRREGAREVTRTQLGGSTGAASELR